MPVMLSDVLPALDTVTFFTLLLCPTVTEPMFSVAAESFTAVPVPLKPTTFGLDASESVMVIVPYRVPAAVGAKWNARLQLDFAGTLPLAGHWPAVLTSAKSPLMAIALMLRATVLLVFVSFTVFVVLLVPSS
jgi:hypothetical protein